MFPLFGIPMGPEVLVILLIAVLLFGAQKIPQLARATGEAAGEFKKARHDIETELEDESTPTEQPATEKPAAETTTNE